MSTPAIERRTGAADLRSEGRKLVGRVCPFNVAAQIGNFSERVMPGAFRQSIASGADIVCLQDHDAGKLLGRTKSGTLQLDEDGAGLNFRLDLAPTQLANDLLEMVRRGDVGGCSIGFLPVQEDWPKPDQRILRSIDLREISIISWAPAYEGTSVTARSWATRSMTPPAARLRLWARTL